MINFTRTFISGIVLCLFIVFFLVFSTILVVVKKQAINLPSVETLQEPIPLYATKILSKDNKIIGQFYEKSRQPIVIDKVPLLLQQAFISAEDRDFWHHKGIDPVAIVRAISFNLHNHGIHRMIGASTITQQVVKNMIVGDEKTFKRKIDEAILALRLENKIGKKRILELYLNDIYLGYGAYGIVSASKVYFQKDLSELKLSDVAFLASLPKGPSNYDPIKFPKKAKERRSYVLQRMFEDGIITIEQKNNADMEPLPIPEKIDNGGVANGYYAEEVRRELVNNLGGKMVYNGGITVHTSMDDKLQPIAEKVIQNALIEYDKRHGWRGVKYHVDGNTTDDLFKALNGLEVTSIKDYPMAVITNITPFSMDVMLSDSSQYTLQKESYKWIGSQSNKILFKKGDVINIHNFGKGWELVQIPEVQGALIAIDVHTGQVLAVSGGFSSDTSSFNRATQSLRQIGSTFKPFIYLTGFEHGYDTISPVLDMPITIDPGNGSPLWSPGADGGHGLGVITVRKALEESRNLASVRMLYDLGIENVEKTAQNFGIYDHINNYASALGAQETTDLKLTTAYAILANGGHKIYPTFIDSVVNAKGDVIVKRPDVSNDTIASPLSIARLTSVLEGVITHGTAYNALHNIKLPMAGKTGTSNNNMDAWFVGYTPDIAVGIHIGYDRPKSLGSHEFGGLAAAPAFGHFIEEYNKIYPSKNNFVIPENTHIEKLDPITGYPSKNGEDVIMYQNNNLKSDDTINDGGNKNNDIPNENNENED